MNTSTANPEADPHSQSDSHSQSGPGPQAGPGAQAGYHPEPPPAGASAGAQQLRRPVEDRMLAGVAGGVARYLGVDVTIVRIIIAVLAVVGGTGVPIYLAGWLLIPEEGCDQSIASEFIQSRQARSR